MHGQGLSSLLAKKIQHFNTALRRCDRSAFSIYFIEIAASAEGSNRMRV